MKHLTFDSSKQGGKFKMLNGTNGGPWHRRHSADLSRSNFEDYKRARIPFSRNHDSALLNVYGGPYSHDITGIFPDFDADPEDPRSYDFACTDESILCTLEAGTKTFFRLGQSIEHQIKKHGTLPPPDFEKWARICEHIIRHYNEGWANGFELGIEYWEIWAEPDLDSDDSMDKRTWGGTKAQFFEFFATAAKYLKGCFPNLKIGGPALAGNEEWAADFLKEMKRNEVKIDFFSWHIYTDDPLKIIKKGERLKKLLVENGYESAESIVDEYNYTTDWTNGFIYTVNQIVGIKGAAFTMACISAAQRSTIDMLLYYDTRFSPFNGVFDFYTCAPLKGYYPLAWYGDFYDMENVIPCEQEMDNIYTICGTNKDGKILAVITYYTNQDHAEDQRVSVDFNKQAQYKVFLLDDEHDAESIGIVNDLSFSMKANSCIRIQEL